MGLLSNPSASQKKSKIIKILVKFERSICAVLYVIGIVWFCALSHRELNNATYFSENALLPGLVYSELTTDTSNFAVSLLEELKHERENYKTGIPYPWLQAKMRQIGLETHTHNFTLHYPLGGGKVYTGKNVYGILRAQRAASTEAFVISVPYRPPNSVHQEITNGIPLMLAYANFARRQKYWAKDIIFLVTEQEQLGVHAWLEAYHGYENSDILNSGELDARAGSIQAAINLEIQSFDIDFIDVKIEGLNGQLPNLDLVKLVLKLSDRENIPSGHKQTTKRRRSGAKSKTEENLKHMLSMVLTQASGVPTGNHGLFHKYGIEAVTLETYRKSSDEGRPINLIALLKIVEGISRSLNNLLERFHQSFFFYLLVASDRYISIGDYIASIGLMAGSLLIKSFVIWLSITSGSDDENNKNAVNMKFQPKYKNYGYISVGIIILAAHFGGFLISYLPYYPIINNLWHSQGIPTEVALYYLFVIVSVCTIVIPRLFQLEYLSSQLLHIFGLIECGTGLIAISMVNFSLGLILCVIIVPFAILIKPRNPDDNKGGSYLRLLTRLYGLVIHPFAVVYAVVLALTWSTFPELPITEILKRSVKASMDAITFAVVDSKIYGNWMFKLITVILLPTWIIFWNVIYPRTAHLNQKLKQN